MTVFNLTGNIQYNANMLSISLIPNQNAKSIAYTWSNNPLLLMFIFDLYHLCVNFIFISFYFSFFWEKESLLDVNKKKKYWPQHINKRKWFWWNAQKPKKKGNGKNETRKNTGKKKYCEWYSIRVCQHTSVCVWLRIPTH